MLSKLEEPTLAGCTKNIIKYERKTSNELEVLTLSVTLSVYKFLINLNLFFWSSC